MDPTQLRTWIRERKPDAAKQCAGLGVNDVVAWLSGYLWGACNSAIPKRPLVTRLRPVYWWSPEIVDLRKVCLAERKRLQKAGRRDAPSWRRTMRQKNSFYLEIRGRQKRNRKKKLCGAVEEDLWKLPYKIVMRKVGGSFPGKEDRGGKITVSDAGSYMLGHCLVGCSGNGL